jgi:catechol 2,3-dioxygenase-like lactoylglutathione lyase family enzyme
MLTGCRACAAMTHTGITVPDMNEALTFFVDVLGCKKAMSFGPIADPEPNGTFMRDALGVDPKTVIKQITLVRCGMGSNIEPFSYQSPDQKVVQVKNSGIGGYHIAFYVDDIKAAADDLHAKNVKTMMGPIPITEGPAAGTTTSGYRNVSLPLRNAAGADGVWDRGDVRTPPFSRPTGLLASVQDPGPIGEGDIDALLA